MIVVFTLLDKLSAAVYLSTLSTLSCSINSYKFQTDLSFEDNNNRASSVIMRLIWTLIFIVVV